MNRTKRALCLMLALVLAVGLFPATAAADQPEELQSVAAFTYNGQTYSIAMGHLEGTGAVRVFRQGSGIGMGFSENNEEDLFYPAYDVVVSVFRNIDDPDCTEHKALIPLITNVQFSVSGQCLQVGATEAPVPGGTDESDPYWHAPLSYLCGNYEGILQAVVTLNLGGTVTEHTLQIHAHTSIQKNVMIDCADPATFPETYRGTDPVDTMDELNALIAGLELSTDPQEETTVILAPVIYEGVLELNNQTGNRNLHIRGSTSRSNGKECATVIRGGIRVKAHGATMSTLYLQASKNHQVLNADEKNCGILTDGGEYSVLSNTVLEGYDIGLANLNGFICPNNQVVFRDCAAGLVITPNAKGNGNSIVKNCRFEGCGVGVRIDGLPTVNGNAYMSNYSFRILNCDFVNSDRADILGGGSGYYYCYGNFFGKVDEDGNVVFRNAKGDKSHVLTNPRMRMPLNAAQWPTGWTVDALTDTAQVLRMSALLRSNGRSAEPENYVTVEQSDEDTVVSDEVTLRNDLAAEYTITDPAFYNRTKPLTVRMLDSKEQYMGSWNFNFPLPEGEEIPDTSPNFDATLQISRTKHAVSVTVSGKRDDCLSLLQPHLAIPCEEEWLKIAVTKDGTALSDVRFEDGMALFPVAAAGTYTITATEVEQTLAVSQAIEAPDGSFDLMDELQTSVALTVPYKAYYTVSTVGRTTEQLGDGAAVTSSDPAIFTVQKAGTAKNAAVFAFTATGIGTASLQYTVDGKTLSVPVTTAAPCAAGIPGGITVGFADYMNPEETMLWLSTNDQPRSFGSSFHPDEEDDTYRPCRPVMVRAGIASDSAGLYEECKDVELEILRLGIQPLTGGDVFSWSPDKVQTELVPDGDLDRVQLYAKNREGNARLWAEVRINGENTVVISARTDMQKIQIIAPEEVDTIPEVEAYLTENKLQGGVIYRFTLKPGKHTDTLDLPENLMGRMIYLCGAENGSTIVEGGIDLHGSGLTEVSGICFTAPDGGSQKAIYGGSVMSVKNCSFYNYDTALDSTAAGLVNPGTGNLFVNNKTAISVDVAQVKQIAHVLCDRNTFINNGTALKVISLHEAVGPFRFRITNSNFINNGLDFDVAYPGTYYFYKNYFGAYDKAGGNPQPGQTAADKSNGRADLELDRVLQARSLNSLKGLLDTRTARIQTAEGVRTITNPRWAYPVAKWWHKDTLDEAAVFGDNILIRTAAAPASGEEEYVNYLTSDWDGTEIINAESTELVLDAKAFEAEAEEKTIDVVQVTDNGSQVDTEVIGTWTFD